MNQKKAVRQTGSYVYEYVGTQALHTKTVLAGDTLSIVGSCNLDMRSVYLDTEMMLFQVAPDGTIIDGENYQIIEQSVGKRIFYGILRILIIPFRHLL